MATYKLKLQLSDGSEITAGTFTVPDGGGGSSSVLYFDFENRITPISEDSFNVFTNPALLIYGATNNPDDGVVSYTVLRMASGNINSDEETEEYVFTDGTRSLIARADWFRMTFEYEIRGGYSIN